MTSTRARHRASAKPFHWATRSVVAVAAVPVGALAGCLLAATSSHEPALGLAGMTIAAVPLALHAWHARRAEHQGRPLDAGRHSALDLNPGSQDALATAQGTAVRVPAPRRAVDAVASVFSATRTTSPVRSTASGQEMLTLPEEVVSGSIDLRPELAPVSPTRAQRDSEIAKLRRLWESGTGPETGISPAVSVTPSEQSSAMAAEAAA